MALGRVIFQINFFEQAIECGRFSSKELLIILAELFDLLVGEGKMTIGDKI